MTGVNRLRSITALVLLGAMTCWSTLVSADPITVEFRITAGPGGGPSLSGSFTGEDTNRNGFLGFLGRSGEVTAFNLDWSGIGPRNNGQFTHSIENLRVLLYNISSHRLLGFLSTNPDGGRDDRTTAALINIGRLVVAGVNDPVRRLRIVLHPRVQTRTTAVPEPGTLTLLGIGLLAIGFASRRRQSDG